MSTTSLEQIMSEFPGFKISNSHFRIGSKIHISDFYYAKRFFQNGFFASRIAFLLAKDIIDRIEELGKIDEIKKEGLTLIGYEMYSELLLSLVDKFLKSKWNLKDKINHNLFEDIEKLKLCKKNNILGNAIIIVPIASTFSTAIKIENQIIKISKKNSHSPTYVFQPHYNVLYVSDNLPSNSLSKLEHLFNWRLKRPERKEIVLDAFYSENNETERVQKYYLTLPTKWYNVEECQLCNPIDREENEIPENEIPLYETDRTSVTPSIIFDYPKGRDIDQQDLDRKYILENETIRYGHHTRNNSHFLYAIDSELFLEKNKPDILKWLNLIKDSANFNQTYKETDRVIIISSCHFSNASFISMVNECLFSASANIIHYDPSNDYIQNFKMVYGKEINDTDKIYFVDDSLKSGSSFDKIYQFIQNTIEPSQEGKGISGCFLLLNKSQPYTFNNLKNKLVIPKEIYAFANLHLYTSLKSEETSSLQIEEERYKELVSYSYLDSLRVHFQKQANKLNLNEDTIEFKPKGEKANRHLRMLIATHRIYQYFTTTANPQILNFYEFINDLLKKTKSPIELDKEEPFISGLNELTKAYLKVLTQSPFAQYKPLKDRVFKWVLFLLMKHMDEVDKAINKDDFNYESFETLKFLIRRAGLLNSNFLFSQGFFSFLTILYSPNGIPKLIQLYGANAILFTSAEQKDEAIYKLSNIHIFYTAQIKELLLKNESRCIRLEKNLTKIDSNTNPYVKQIARILRAENSIIIRKFYEHLCGQDNWKKIYYAKDSNAESIDYTNENIISFLKKTSIFQHHKYQTLDAYFRTINQPVIIENKKLLIYLWLKYFLSFDKEKKISLNDKTEYLMNKLLELFTDSGIIKPGAFFIVNDNKGNPFYAYNRNWNGSNEINNPYWDSYLLSFFRGKENSYTKNVHDKHYKTMTEFVRDNNQWIDLYRTSEKEIIDIDPDIVSPDYNRLMLIRLSKKNTLTSIEKPQGIIGFFYRKEDGDLVDVNINKYILLLRSSISSFIEKHHENDEFRDWQIAEIKQKTSLLTGHGREMLINIAINHRRQYENIVSTLLKVQRLIIDKKEEANIRIGSSNYNETSSWIAKIFSAFFQKNTELTDTYFIALSKMAQEIFSFEEIENREELNEPVPITDGLPFKFDTELLNMICFEILVNAKKNRWLFMGEKIETVDGDIYDKNRLWIEASKEGEKLKISISNTGPKLESSEMIDIKRKKNPKGYDDSSGIELINTVLTEFNLGEIDFTQKQIKDELYKFTATMKLNENPNGS